MTAPRRKPRPDLPGDELARIAKFAKPQFARSFDAQADTRGLQHPKLHPDRDPGYLRWLPFETCSIRGKKGHVCWSKRWRGGIALCDPAHTGKAISGRKKQNDSGCFSLCRAAHDEQERNMDAFDEKYGIDRHAIAAEQHARYLAGGSHQ